MNGTLCISTASLHKNKAKTKIFREKSLCRSLHAHRNIGFKIIPLSTRSSFIELCRVWWFSLCRYQELLITKQGRRCFCDRKQTCHHKNCWQRRFKNQSIQQICSVNNSSAMRSYYFGTQPKQRTEERNMATRHKQLRLPTSSGLDSQSPSSDKHCKESLGNPSEDHWGSTGSYISSKFVAVVPFSCQIQSQNVISISLLRLNCNKMESTAALCSSFLRISDQSPTIRRANSQPPASGQGVHACCQTADVNYWPSPPPPLPFVGARVFPERSERIRKQNNLIRNTRLAFRLQCVASNGKRLRPGVFCLFVFFLYSDSKQVYLYEGINGCSSCSAFTGTCLMFTPLIVSMNL